MVFVTEENPRHPTTLKQKIDPVHIIFVLFIRLDSNAIIHFANYPLISNKMLYKADFSIIYCLIFVSLLCADLST